MSQIIRFIIAGSTASLVNYLISKSIYLIFKNIFFASVLGYSIGLLVSYLLAKIWVFKDSSKKRFLKSFSFFSLIYVLGGIEMSLIIFFVNGLIDNYEISWFLGAFCAAINNYLGSKYLLFKQ